MASFRAYFLNGEFTEDFETQAEAVGAIQTKVETDRGNTRVRKQQLEATVWELRGGTYAKLRHFVYQSGSTQRIEVMEPPSDKVRRFGDLDDLRLVGPHKPLGYLPSPYIEELGSSVESMRQECEAKGLCTWESHPETSNDFYGALYVYDAQVLQQLLDRKKSVLIEAGWPLVAEAFVIEASRRGAAAYTPLFDLIADAFGDEWNPGRTKWIISKEPKM